jgi:hypothetical protein
VGVAGGPGNSTDWIALFAVGAPDSGYLSWSYLNGTTAPPTNGQTSATVLTYAPLAAGDYEWRLFANNGWTRIATSGVVTVTASAATLAINGLSAPAVASVVAGSNVAVSLSEGPANATDFLRGLLDACGIPLPWFFTAFSPFLPSHPGAQKPVPLQYFSIQ